MYIQTYDKSNCLAIWESGFNPGGGGGCLSTKTTSVITPGGGGLSFGVEGTVIIRPRGDEIIEGWGGQKSLIGIESI